ncbi:MAG: hypothetical protein HY862_17585 [Chloroflexi bacterium]|nr:hypothetical protein [Chloroflexota bacterium]
MKFIIWTLFLTAVAVFVLAILVGIFTGREYRLEMDPDNPRNQGHTDMTIDRDNFGAVLFIGILGIASIYGAIRNWRTILWPISTAREVNK